MLEWNGLWNGVDSQKANGLVAGRAMWRRQEDCFAVDGGVCVLDWFLDWFFGLVFGPVFWTGFWTGFLDWFLDRFFGPVFGRFLEWCLLDWFVACTLASCGMRGNACLRLVN